MTAEEAVRGVWENVRLEAEQSRLSVGIRAEVLADLNGWIKKCEEAGVK